MTLTRRRALAALSGPLALSACGHPAFDYPTPYLRGAEPYDLRLAKYGLRIPSAQRNIEFGRTEASVVAAMEKVLGDGPESRATNGECGAGPVTTLRYDEGVDLHFLDGALQGWSTDDDTLDTVTGFVVGQSRAGFAIGLPQLIFRATSLGTEVELSPGIFALMTSDQPDAKIQLMWSGVTCFFR